MATTQTRTDDSTGLKDGDTVNDFGQFHGRLANKLHELQTRVPENYYMDVTYSPYSDGTDRVSVVIDSDDFIANEGEIGDMHFHIILGPRGGLRLADSRRTLVEDKTDYVAKNDTKGDAWSELLRAVKRAL